MIKYIIILLSLSCSLFSQKIALVIPNSWFVNGFVANYIKDAINENIKDTYSFETIKGKNLSKLHIDEYEKVILILINKEFNKEKHYMKFISQYPNHPNLLIVLSNKRFSKTSVFLSYEKLKNIDVITSPTKEVSTNGSQEIINILQK